MEQELLQRIETLEAKLKKLESTTTIPLEVDRAFRARLGLEDLASLDYVNGLAIPAVSAKGADTEDVSVNEAGAGTYAVMGDPDGFLEVPIAGTTYYVPYFE